MNKEVISGVTALFVDPVGPLLASEEDALDLMGASYGTGADMLVLPVSRLDPAFLDLSTRLAGHFFQKMQNYRMRLAILGDISAPLRASTALRDFVGETNRIGHHLFVDDRAALAARLGGSV